MQVQKRRFLNASLITLLSAAAMGAGRVPSAAQQTVPPAQRILVPSSEASGMPLTYLSVLRAVSYDPAERGPLLAVIPQPFILVKTMAEAKTARINSLSSFAEATDTRLFPAGQINALVPRMITTINTKPGKANPFGDLSASDTLKLLLSTFTPAQWKQVGGALGIGESDLTDDQKVLWSQMLPEQAKVQKSKIEAGDTPRSLRYTDTTLLDVHPRATGRLRLSKTVTFSFYKPGGTDTAWGGDPYMGSDRVGETKTMLLNLDQKDRGKPGSAYGVSLLSEQTNRLKTGAVDFAAPVLDKRVALGNFPPHVPIAKEAAAKTTAASVQPLFSELYAQAQNELSILPTVGDLLLQITQTTGVEFVADHRVRELPVYLRGESARVGDVLMALCLSVGGAFRKIEPSGATDTAPLYLLTDDVEGIGARTARLAEWADAADELKRRITDKADEAAAKNDPLAYLSFAPGDAFALSDTQVKRIEDSWRKEKYGTPPDVLAREMSSALKKAVQDFLDMRDGEGISLQADRVRVGEELRAYLLLPEVGGSALEADELGNAIGHQYLQLVAFDPSKKNTEPKPTKPAPIPAPGFSAPALQKQRRVLIAHPKTETEAAQIVRSAVGSGITEVWLETSLADPKSSAALLTKATTAGGKKIAVGALLSLLKEKDASAESDSGLGEPDRNILGETGEAHRIRAASEYTGNYAERYQEGLRGFAGWRAIESASAPAALELRRRVLLIAGVPNLAGLTFRATGGPGWTGQKDGGDGLYTNTAQGYTASMRRAFFRSSGIDPIDIPDMRWQLGGIQWNLGYFKPGDGRGEYEVINQKVVRRSADAIPSSAWWAFRKKRNMEMAASVFKAVRTLHPTLPLYTDDRVSSYNSFSTDWFGSWDTPEGLPDFSPFHVESETRADARRTSKSIFAHWGSWWDADDAAKPDAPATFARMVSASALRNPPPSWDGLVIDLSNVPAALVPTLLEGLPKTPPRP